VGIVDLIKDNLLEKQNEQPQAKEKTIRIECKGATLVALDELNTLQGRLKDLTDKNYNKLKASILKHGFSFPIFMWIDANGMRWVVDAHQRKRVLTRMRDTEGYIIPPLPAAIIFAKHRKEAKEKLLAQESHYGKTTEEGLYEFMNEEGFELNPAELIEEVTFPEFDMEYGQIESVADESEKTIQKPQRLECPNCHHKGEKDEFIAKP
jgi:hypothetical protein